MTQNLLGHKPQSRMESVVESLLNTFAGIVISYSTVEVILVPWLGIGMTSHQNAVLTLVLTVISIIRSYIFRRIFNNRSWKHLFK